MLSKVKYKFGQSLICGKTEAFEKPPGNTTIAPVMKIVAILAGVHGFPHFKDLYIQPHLRLQDVFRKHKILLVEVTLSAFQSNRGFSHYFVLGANGEMKKINKTITPDSIWSRGSSFNLFIENHIRKTFPVVPQFSIGALSSDKYESYIHLRKYMPRTTLLGNFLCSSAVQKTFGKQIVLKPIRNYGGRGIQFTDKKTVLKNMDSYMGHEKSIIVQEFKDFGKGYKKLIQGVHDLRLVYV